VQSTCTKVGDVLSNGPDPDADPVGYAEAQPLPLRGISTSDPNLKAAIDALASAYENFYQSGGAKTGNKAITAASNNVNAICPGAAS
jgi:hypothetical protein